MGKNRSLLSSETDVDDRAFLLTDSTERTENQQIAFTRVANRAAFGTS